VKGRLLNDNHVPYAITLQDLPNTYPAQQDALRRLPYSWGPSNIIGLWQTR